jgi:nickel-dependent lactate racemase
VSTVAAPSPVISKAVVTGFLPSRDIEATIAEGLAAMDLDGGRVLVLIPDGTRTMPMPLVFAIFGAELAGRVRKLDYLIATGTHVAMSDAQLGTHVGREVTNGMCGESRIFNHVSDDDAALVTLGVIPAAEISAISGGLLAEDVTVRLNRAILDYDHILICGPVFPHEVAGFSGGAKYFFPGIAGRAIIDFTHWLGALVLSSEIIGVAETPVRRVIHRAAALVPVAHTLVALVTHHEGVGGVFCGDTVEAWREAAALSARRHIIWLDRPVRRMLAIMPEMYADLWTGAKGMYKSEPAVADGGEVVIYAPHIREVSRVHGRIIEEIGYHCRDYFLGQWERFRHYPGGVIAHSTHVKGKGTYDIATGVETPRIHVTLATGIPEAVCRSINLGYLDPAAVDPEVWRARQSDGWLVVPRAGEMLYRIGAPQSGQLS